MNIEDNPIWGLCWFPLLTAAGILQRRAWHGMTGVLSNISYLKIQCYSRYVHQRWTKQSYIIHTSLFPFWVFGFGVWGTSHRRNIPPT
jgi:hypothetical protein